MRADPPTPGFALVVPVKLLVRAKTRLARYGEAARGDLALAFAGDVVVAALRSPAVRCVLVVTDDLRAAAELAGGRVRVVPDQTDDGLNAALSAAAALLRDEHPDLGVAVLVSDLPCLRPPDLAPALAAVRGRGFVADAAGLGTTLLAAAPGHELLPAFGPHSRARHLASGARELPATPTLRRDVDSPLDLAEALRLGVGRRTCGVVAGLAGVEAG